MRIIPVLDILNAQVVHGVKGERNKYAPVKSLLTPSSDPLDIANAFKTHFHTTEIYIADLDSIMHGKSDFSYIEDVIAQLDFRIMLDAGIDDIETTKTLLGRGVAKIIIGTETLRSLANLEALVDKISTDKLILSLDMKEGSILTHASELKNLSPTTAVQKFQEMGIRELIALELTKVGSETGIMTQVLRRILQFASIPIITGGGARNVEDLIILRDAGVAGVLIATALHKGTISAQHLKVL
jgi:phosphoribosylformimino-5-aminoimidazole carboxamide ribotide isomerase